MERIKGEWYQSKKGWGTAVLRAIYFVLDHWGRATTAKDIYHFAVDPVRNVWPHISPFVPFLLFGIAVAFFEIDRRRQPKVSGSKLVIHSALYGIGSFNDVSVLGKVNSAVRDGLVIPVDNNLVDGDDPARNQPKRLRIEYSYGNSARRVVERPESQPGHPSVLVLPEECEFRVPTPPS